VENAAVAAAGDNSAEHDYDAAAEDAVESLVGIAGNAAAAAAAAAGEYVPDKAAQRA